MTIAALKNLADDEQISVSRVQEAIQKFNINPEKPNPVTV
jgi:pyruvate dehydrogenase E1 component